MCKCEYDFGISCDRLLHFRKCLTKSPLKVVWLPEKRPFPATLEMANSEEKHAIGRTGRQGLWEGKYFRCLPVVAREEKVAPMHRNIGTDS